MKDPSRSRGRSTLHCTGGDDNCLGMDVGGGGLWSKMEPDFGEKSNPRSGNEASSSSAAMVAAYVSVRRWRSSIKSSGSLSGLTAAIRSMWCRCPGRKMPNTHTHTHIHKAPPSHSHKPKPFYPEDGRHLWGLPSLPTYHFITQRRDLKVGCDLGWKHQWFGRHIYY